MSQTTLDDDELFGEAASEMRSDVESSLAEARAALPAVETVWETDGENVLGVLNGLRSALDTGEAQDHLRDAKKWYTMGKRADAFEDGDDLANELEELEAILETIEAVEEQVGELTATVPELKTQLEATQNEEEPDD